MKSVFIFLLASALYSQPLNLTTNNRIPGYYTVFNGVEINFNNESFTLIKDSVEICTKLTSGTKIFLTSDNMQYCAIVNFGFRKDKSDYPVEIYTYSKDLDSISYSFEAPYDLPHPSINLNNDGAVFLFNPLNYQVTELTKEGKKEYSLEKSVEFEMERSFFSDINNGEYFLFISEKPLSPEEDAENVYLYTSDLSFQNINKRIIDAEVPVSLSFFGDDIIVSGVEFTTSGILMKSFIINENFTREIPFAFEKIVELKRGYAAKFAATLYTFDSDFSLVASKVFDQNIADIAVNDSDVVVLTNNSGWKLLSVDSAMNIKTIFQLNDVGSGKLPVLSKADGKILLYDNNFTHIIN